MKLKESETLELKKSTSELKEAIISIVSILNKHQKGELYFGVNSDGSAVRQDIGKETLKDISKSISDNIEPKIFPKIIPVSLDGKSCIHAEFSGSECPYYAYGRSYIRVSDEDKKLSAKEVEKMILEKNKDKLAWDKEICEEAKLTDISKIKLKEFLKIAGLEYSSLNNSLKKLALIKDGKLLNSAVILFSENPVKFFPNARLRCAVFGTTDTSFAIDMQEFYGDLFYLIKKAEEYILSNIHIGMRLEGLRRVDVPEINKEAFREAVINAFCHRNYYQYDSVNIAIFKDKVEIRSPGLLYGGLTINRIKKENISERRNEIIAEMFHKVHFVEKWGKGIKLILSKEPTADFKEVGRQFISVFKRKGVEKPVEEVILEKTGEKSTRKVPEKYQKILDELIGKPDISRIELAKKLNEEPTTIQSKIRKLVKDGLIKRIGPDKGGHWEIIK